jgi:small GTP-binding protein
MDLVDVKVVLVGSARVGKSSIVHQYMNGFFSHSQRPTLGVAYSTRTVTVDSRVVHLQIWDTGGAEKYRSMTPMYYHKAKVALVIYSVTDSLGFGDVNMWMDSPSNHADRNIILFLVANKIDLVNERVIPRGRGQERAEQYGATYVEVSAVTGRGIEDLFAEVPRRFCEKSQTIDEVTIPGAALQRQAEATGPEDSNHECC